jgi:hypothetical protein
MLDPIPQESTQMISVSFDLATTHRFAVGGGQSIAAEGG